jgi:hypothetical protein
MAFKLGPLNLNAVAQVLFSTFCSSFFFWVLFYNVSSLISFCHCEIQVLSVELLACVFFFSLRLVPQCISRCISVPGYLNSVRALRRE